MSVVYSQRRFRSSTRAKLDAFRPDTPPLYLKPQAIAAPHHRHHRQSGAGPALPHRQRLGHLIFPFASNSIGSSATRSTQQSRNSRQNANAATSCLCFLRGSILGFSAGTEAFGRAYFNDGPSRHCVPFLRSLHWRLPLPEWNPLTNGRHKGRWIKDLCHGFHKIVIE